MADRHRYVVAAAAMLLLAFVVRVWDFGDPVLDLDEQWYLLVGTRMLDGAVPYLDLWDRKPPGLFLLYALMQMLPGDGIVAYQIVATIFAAATATMVWAISALLGARRPACYVAGALYLLTASMIGGQGGQAPVFYNLPVAVAVFLTLRLPDLVRRRVTRRIALNGLVACALVGLAIQIKYTAAFEGVFVGLAHLWAMHRVRCPWWKTAASGTAFAAAGLLPTLIVMGVYRSLGTHAFEAFWFANFVSISLRRSYPVVTVLQKLGSIAGQLSPLILAASAAGTAMMRRPSVPPVQRLALGWFVAAVVGFVSIGTFHDHYALPLLPPLAAIAALALSPPRSPLAIIVPAASVAIFAGERLTMSNDAPAIRQVAALVHDRSADGCPYVFMGDPIIYHLARSCIPTPYAFPNTLGQAIEQGATGVDEAAEVRRIMSTRPPIVVTSDRKRTIWNERSRAVVRAALAVDYTLIGIFAREKHHLLVYERDRGRRSPPRSGHSIRP